MHFLLLLLRMVLDCLIPAWRDGLTMAARADGRVEHLPTRPALWDRWLGFTRHAAPRREGKRATGEALRAGTKCAAKDGRERPEERSKTD